ncbi:MAG TPA: carboxypeptidase-like regulatory domain-containing protein, partial [Flavitalea sp.]|nr:carboxypeptidase-like regulatory domain-containing protein [Flavitalea sp.]
MKPTLLLSIFIKARFILCTFILSGPLCSALWANDGSSPPANNFHNTYFFQDSTVTGKITDKGGNPITGVSVLEKGTQNGTITDNDGRYTLKVKDPRNPLVVSFVGYTTREIAAASSSDTITLESLSANLEDVVVVGYGTQRRSELTNAVVQTTGTELKKSNTLSLSNSLSGRLGGLFVTQTSAAPGFDDAQILVRGPKTFRNSSALVVIDGV